MRLRRIDLAGFGCLTDFRAEFAPGLNVFFGENEAGKSTLQQAVCALLYGFFDNDRARPEETARYERFRPWPDGRLAAAPYRGALEYELEDGITFEARRDFSTADVATQLIDAATGTDVAARYGHGRHGNVPFARRQLGMSRAVFQSCAFIGQGEVLEVSNGASPREIGDAIAALADSSRRDVSANAAVGRLDALLQRIGSDRARTAELPSAREALRLAEDDLGALESAQRVVSQQAAELQAARARSAAVERDVTRGQVLFLKARGASLERKLKELTEANGALARARALVEELAFFAQFPVTSRDAVLRLLDRQAGEREAARTARQELEQKHAEVSDSDRLEFEALRASVGSLSGESVAHLRSAAYGAGPAQERRPNLLVRVLRVLQQLPAAIVRRFFRRRSEAASNEASAVPAVSRDEAQALLERHTRYLMLHPAITAVVEAEGRVRAANAVLAAAEDELKAVLASAGITDGEGLDEAVAEFLEGCRKRTLYDAAEAEGQEAERRRRLLLGEKSPEELRQQLDESGTRLNSLLAAHPDLAGLQADANQGEIARRLEKLQEERHSLEVKAARLDEEVRSALREHRPRAEIEEDAERWRREVIRLERARAAAQTAREVISEAMVSVYRDFAPAVNAFLSDGFQYITEDRYQRAHVDPATLRVSLLLPETGRVIVDPPVSRGTLSAAYILMRVGLAQHMSGIGEPVPLVLDDPFVDMDGRRLRRMLEFILRITEQAQVLLFTKDEQVIDWFETECGDGRHRVHRLSGSSLLTPTV